MKISDEVRQFINYRQLKIPDKMYSYADDYEPKCFCCDHHEIVMCDADMNASFCKYNNIYCCNVASCEKWDEVKRTKSDKS